MQTVPAESAYSSRQKVHIFPEYIKKNAVISDNVKSEVIYIRQNMHNKEV